MNFIQSIMNLFERRETKRQGETDFESIREIEMQSKTRF